MKQAIGGYMSQNHDYVADAFTRAPPAKAAALAITLEPVFAGGGEVAVLVCRRNKSLGPGPRKFVEFCVTAHALERFWGPFAITCEYDELDTARMRATLEGGCRRIAMGLPTVICTTVEFGQCQAIAQQWQQWLQLHAPA